MSESKKKTKTVAPKALDINALKSGILNEVNTFKEEKNRNDPNTILLSISDEIKAMFDAGMTVQKQIQTLKANGLNINTKIYKSHIEQMGYGK